MKRDSKIKLIKKYSIIIDFLYSNFNDKIKRGDFYKISKFKVSLLNLQLNNYHGNKYIDECILLGDEIISAYNKI